MHVSFHISIEGTSWTPTHCSTLQLSTEASDRWESTWYSWWHTYQAAAIPSPTASCIRNFVEVLVLPYCVLDSLLNSFTIEFRGFQLGGILVKYQTACIVALLLYNIWIEISNPFFIVLSPIPRPLHALARSRWVRRQSTRHVCGTFNNFHKYSIP